jgi:hypothetical protein
VFSKRGTECVGTFDPLIECLVFTVSAESQQSYTACIFSWDLCLAQSAFFFGAAERFNCTTISRPANVSNNTDVGHKAPPSDLSLIIVSVRYAHSIRFYLIQRRPRLAAFFLAFGLDAPGRGMSAVGFTLPSNQ